MVAVISPLQRLWSPPKHRRRIATPAWQCPDRRTARPSTDDMSLFLAILIATSGPARASVPAFADYPAVAEPTPLVEADLASNPGAHGFRTRIRQSDKKPVNFAGVFTVLRIGCGTSCAFLILVDRRDGKIVFFPRGVLSWAGDSGNDKDYGFTFRRDSRLLRSCGMLNESRPPTCRYDEWTDTGPRLVVELPWKRHKPVEPASPAAGTP